MDLGRPNTITEVRALMGMFHYYRDMWPRWYHILAPLTEVAIVPKGRKILWNDALEDSFKELNLMVSDKTLLSYLNFTIAFTIHTNISNKQLGAVISHNNKPIEFSQ